MTRGLCSHLLHLPTSIPSLSCLLPAPAHLLHWVQGDRGRGEASAGRGDDEELKGGVMRSKVEGRGWAAVVKKWSEGPLTREDGRRGQWWGGNKAASWPWAAGLRLWGCSLQYSDAPWDSGPCYCDAVAAILGLSSPSPWPSCSASRPGGRACGWLFPATHFVHCQMQSCNGWAERATDPCRT